jgi:ribosome modulation factor
MDERDAIEQAYKNGYEAGVRELAERVKNICGNTSLVTRVIDRLVKELTVNYESSKPRKEDEGNEQKRALRS